MLTRSPALAAAAAASPLLTYGWIPVLCLSLSTWTQGRSGKQRERNKEKARTKTASVSHWMGAAESHPIYPSNQFACMADASSLAAAAAAEHDVLAHRHLKKQRVWCSVLSLIIWCQDQTVLSATGQLRSQSAKWVSGTSTRTKTRTRTPPPPRFQLAGNLH